MTKLAKYLTAGNARKNGFACSFAFPKLPEGNNSNGFQRKSGQHLSIEHFTFFKSK
ncbi:hypothetical protein QEG73_15475 [Chitinophagaceae bacterium 26-R-25]|nr:hypothetical protein [Chitinophagaceae bacterium 26-R-25]